MTRVTKERSNGTGYKGVGVRAPNQHIYDHRGEIFLHWFLHQERGALSRRLKER